jgi:hypothetical protein
MAALYIAGITIIMNESRVVGGRVHGKYDEQRQQNHPSNAPAKYQTGIDSKAAVALAEKVGAEDGAQDKGPDNKADNLAGAPASSPHIWVCICARAGVDALAVISV